MLDIRMGKGKSRKTKFATLSELIAEKGVPIAKKAVGQIVEGRNEVKLFLNDSGGMDVDLSDYTFCFCFNDFEEDEAALNYLRSKFRDGIRSRSFGGLHQTLETILDLVHRKENGLSKDDGVMVVYSSAPELPSSGNYGDKGH
jgi:hypothetical protein